MSQDKKDWWIRAGVIFTGILCISVIASAIIFCGQVLQMPDRMDKFEHRMDKIEEGQALAAVAQSRTERELEDIARQGGFKLPGDGSDYSDDDYTPYPKKSAQRESQITSQD